MALTVPFIFRFAISCFDFLETSRIYPSFPKKLMYSPSGDKTNVSKDSSFRPEKIVITESESTS